MTISTVKSQFSSKYEVGSDWGGHSGGGSIPFYTLKYRAFVEEFVCMNHIRKVVDIGCGDWQFSRYIDFHQAQYYGYDIVDSVIDNNTAVYSSERVKFSLMPDEIDHIQGGDLLIMKDVLQHLPDQMIIEYRDKLFKKFNYCLLTNSFQKINTPHNINIDPGDFRSLDLTKFPYDIQGCYVVSFMSPLWEEIRTLLVQIR